MSAASAPASLAQFSFISWTWVRVCVWAGPALELSSLLLLYGSWAHTLLRWQVPLLPDTSCPVCPILEREFILILISWVVFFSLLFWGGGVGQGTGSCCTGCFLNSCSSTSGFGITGVFVTICTHFQVHKACLLKRYCVYFFVQKVGWHMLQCTCGGQNTALRNGFSFTFPGVLGFALRLWGLWYKHFLSSATGSLAAVKFSETGSQVVSVSTS